MASFGPWSVDEAQLHRQWLTLQALNTTLLVVRKLGPTIQTARQVGGIHESSEHARVWFDPILLTLNVRFCTPVTDNTKQLMASLCDGAFHGFLGPFEVAGTKTDGDHIVVQLAEPSGVPARIESPDPLFSCHA